MWANNILTAKNHRPPSKNLNTRPEKPFFRVVGQGCPKASKHCRLLLLPLLLPPEEKDKSLFLKTLCTDNKSNNE